MALSPQERSRRMRLNMLMAMSYAVAGRTTFTPLSLFSAGEVGAWYDPSDFSTMFQDAAGTTPVTGVEQPVGLILDKSKGLAIGPELITNGTFDTDTTGWTLSAGSASVSGGQVTISGVVTRFLTQAFTTVVGVTYKVTGQIVTSGATFNAIRKSDNTTASSNVVTILSAAGTGTGYFTATATTSYIVLQVNDAGTATFDNISVKSIAGNHASQTTSTSRPVLSARVNLLTYTEDWRNTATAGSTRPWTYNGGTITADATSAPDGTSTADALFETATTSAHLISQQITGTAGFTYRASVSIKANGRDYAFVRVSDAVSNVHAVSVNLTNGTAASANGSPTNITCTAQANGFYRVTFDAPGYSTTQFDVMTSSDGVYANRSFLGDITKGVYVWGADLRSATAGSSLPPYQRVGAATAGSSSAAGTGDYDTTGFPYYLSFDGTDDFLVTGTINFSATDKMAAFAGVRKLSDAARGVLLELSATRASNNGSFTIDGPGAVTATDKYVVASKGTVDAFESATASGLTAPVTNVLAATFDISGDVARLRANGSQVAETLADQGTGNYGSYPLYIGRRGGSSLPFNGRLHGLVVVGRALTSTEITNMETWMNTKTKAY